MPLLASTRILFVQVFLLLTFYIFSGRTEETCTIDYNEIPLSLPQNCTALTITGKNLQTLEPDTFLIWSSSSLTELDISDTGITGIQSQALCFPSLLVLDLSLNNIKGIDSTSFSNMTDLEELYLHGNIIRMISDDAFAQQTKLKILRLDGNSLTQVNFFLQPLRNLETLNLTNNEIRSVAQTAFRENDKMKDLLLAYNHLTDIPAAGGMRKLHVLNLQSNEIRGNLTASQVHFEYLEELRLTNNFISQINLDAFQYLDMLEELYLDHNQLTTFEAWSNSQQGIRKIQLDHNLWDCSCSNKEPWHQIRQREQDGELTVAERNETHCSTPTSKKYSTVFDVMESCPAIPTLHVYYILIPVASVVALIVIITAVACCRKRRKSPHASPVPSTPTEMRPPSTPHEGGNFDRAHPSPLSEPAPIYHYVDNQKAILQTVAIQRDLSHDYVNNGLVKQQQAHSKVNSGGYLEPLPESRIGNFGGK